jgi:hypothetical protein
MHGAKRDCGLDWLAQCCGMEQWLARWAHNPKVGGSNPSPAMNESRETIGFEPVISQLS